jgi:cytochrome c oxidase subunit IV
MKYLDKTTLIWLSLTLLTIFAFLFSLFELLSPFLIAILLISTFIKGQLIIDYFMGLKRVSLGYRLIPSIWLILVLLLISIAYYLPVT